MLLKIKVCIALLLVAAIAVGLEMLAWSTWEARGVLQDTTVIVFAGIFSILGLMVGTFLFCLIWKPELFEGVVDEGDSSVALNTTLVAVQLSSIATMNSITRR